MSKISNPFTFHQSQTPTTTDEEVNNEEVPIDTGLIRCICESTEDDGFTIQCDKCLTWQHAFCMNISQNNIPDQYSCNDCVKGVTTFNNQRSSKNNNNTLYESTPSTTTTTTTTTTTNTIADTGLLNNTSTKPYSSKRKEDKNKSTNNRSLSVKSNSHNKRTRETVVQEEYQRSHKSSSKKPKLSKRIPIPKRSLQQQQQQQNNIESESEENIIDNSIYDNNNDHHKNLKHHHHHHHHHHKKKDKYHHIDFNTINSKFVHEIMKDTIKRWNQSSKWKSQPWRDADQQDISTSSTSRKHQPHEPFIIMDNTSLKQSALNHISIRSLPKHHHHSSSRLRKGVFADTQLNANTFLMEVHGEILLKTEYKFDVANDYSILGTACEHVLFYPTLDLCIDSRELGNDGRYFRRSCHPNAELRTLVFHTNDSSKSLITDHDNNNINDINDSNNHHHHNKSIRLGVFTRTNIDQGEEITLGWNWQKGHISWRKNVEWYRSSHLDQSQNKTFIHDTKDDKSQLNSINQLQHSHQQHHFDNKIDEKVEMKSHYAIELMMERFDDEFGNCACGDRDVCLIEKLRQECLLYNNINNNKNNSNMNNNNNNDNDSHINGCSSSLESTSSLQQQQQQQQQQQETGKVLQQSRQAILSSKVENEKSSSGNSPAPGSAEENVDIDVISMSPITRSPIISMSHPIIDQVKKSTLDNSGNGDDILDIDSDIDIENKLQTGQTSSPPNSVNPSSLFDEESGNGGGDNDDGHVNKKRKQMIKSEQDGNDDTVLKKNFIVKNKKPVLPCKKIWAKNFSQRDLKIENNQSTLIVSEDNIQEKPYSINHTTKVETLSTYELSSHQNNIINNDTFVNETSSEIKPEADIDDGELSDASSASTIPLEEDDRNWSLREPNHSSTSVYKNNDISEITPNITTTNKNNHHKNLESSSTPPSTTSLDTLNESTQQNNNESTVVDKDNKNYISDTKLISPNINEPSITQQQVESSPLEVKEKSTTLEIGINDDKDVDQTKPPTKVKVSLQEYLSRRLANQDSPSQ